MPFEIRFEGHVWRTDDLLLTEAIRIEEATGRSWMLINPFRYAEDARQVIATFLARNGETFVDAISRVETMRIGDVVGAFAVVDDDVPTSYSKDGAPLAEDDPGTAGSSPAPDGSDGPPT